MNNRTIVITGTSTLNVKTDYVKIKFDIDKKDLSYEKTLLLLTEQIDAITKIVLKNGFTKNDLKTTDFNVEKDTKYDNKSKEYHFVGYMARETLNLSFPIDNKKINSILHDVCAEIKYVDFNISFYCTIQCFCFNLIK